MPRQLLYIVVFLMFTSVFYGQNTPEKLNTTKTDTVFIPEEDIDILAPSRAAFYSAVLPGLGQVYNRKYWKVPLVYGALGTGVYFYVHNKDLYDEFRDAYKAEIAGRPHIYDGTAEGKPELSKATLERAQNLYRKNKDLSLFVTIGLYILNIVEANVDAHLPDKALNTNISFNPGVFTAPVTNQPVYGATISFNF